MTFNTITNSIKNKIENIQKADQKKNLKIKDITLIPEFEKLLAMDDSVVNAMTESMKNEGFKSGHELHIWAHDGKFILIDGHTRRHCANKAGLTSVPCIIHHFNTLEKAKKFAIREQTDRRNLSGEALLQAVANFNFEKGKGNAGDEKGKASEIIGKQLGVSSKTVEKARVVLKEATEEQKEAIRKEELSVNQVYNQIRGKASAEKAEASQPKLSTKEKTEKERWYTALFKKFSIKIGDKTVEVNKGLTDAYIEKSTQLAEWENRNGDELISLGSSYKRYRVQNWKDYLKEKARPRSLDYDMSR